ncbi:MAG: pseudaminic acid synthase [Candidatus Hydrogenedentes bacterium]|nr:pseudaminic acid synthase [Candidatus Hydrogenedentota bacterium]
MAFSSHLHIGGRRVGPDEPVYVVAELSGNHLGDYARAEALVRAAHDAGANAVKLQTYTPDTMTIDCDGEPFRITGGTAWDGRTEYDVYREAQTPWEWQARLQSVAHSLKMDFFSTAFDATSVAFLEDLHVPVHKVASFELTDHALIRAVAATGKPVVLSTGLATLDEIEEAVNVAANAKCNELALLQCVSAYPAPPSDMRLRTIPDLASRFGVVAGLSDHTLGSVAAVAAVAVGACIIEKHITLARADGGPDGSFSTEPAEFRALVDAIRTAESALGQARYGPSESETPLRMYRRSLFVVENMKKGEEFTTANIRSIRPGQGLPPKRLAEVLGRHAACDILRGTPLSDSLID